MLLLLLEVVVILVAELAVIWCEAFDELFAAFLVVYKSKLEILPKKNNINGFGL